MTTWELASATERRELGRVIERARRAGVELPEFPATAREAGLQGLTKRDAGVLRTWLREAMGEPGAAGEEGES